MMPQTIGGVEYLNARETAKALDNMSYVTFQKVRELPEIKAILKPETFLGKGNAVYYRKDQVEEVLERFIRKSQPTE